MARTADRRGFRHDHLPHNVAGSGSPTLGVVRVRPLAGQIHEQLTKAIVTLEIAPGTRVVIEELASLMGVSRTPLREALPRLIGDGLLEELSNGLLRVLPITDPYVREVHQARAGLEGIAASLATPQIPQNVLTDLERRFQVVETQIRRGDLADYFESDTAFHKSVMDHCGNSYLKRMLAGLLNHIYRIRNFSRVRSGDHVLASHSEHVEILRAMTARDSAQAKQFMENHVLAAGDRVARLV